MSSPPTQDDFFAFWQRRQQASAARSHRPTMAAELAFWSDYAAKYDATGSLARAAPEIVQRVQELVWPDATVLEIGAGTGEFTLPVATLAASVTAVDISPHMLAELERKAAAARITNITAFEADWETLDAAPHDI